jgi:ribosomal protein S18 acetylase RimI-like enzyme
VENAANMTRLTIVSANTSDKQTIAQLIASINHDPADHCLHCDQEEAGVLEELAMLEVPLEESFVVAWEGERMVGVLGADVAAEWDRAWLWGPFISGADWEETAANLYDHLIEKFPPTMRQLDQFLNTANERGRAFYKVRGFEETKFSHVYQVLPPAQPIKKPYPEMKPPHWRQFIALHEETFPTTYFSGRDIIERLGKKNKVFVCAEGETVLGYVYANVEPSEGFIHFLAVRQDRRGQGIGEGLLRTAVSWLFNKQHVPQIGLVVDDENNARKLYEKVGFRLLHSGVGLRKETPSIVEQ